MSNSQKEGLDVSASLCAPKGTQEVSKPQLMVVTYIPTGISQAGAKARAPGGRSGAGRDQGVPL